MNREEVIGLPSNAELKAATLILASITGRHHSKVFRRLSCRYSPSISPITGAPTPDGSGMVITTSFSSKLSSCSSYSMLTSQPFPLSEGQQLIVSGIKDSSVVCSLHFSTPTSLLTGNDFSGFFKPIRDSAVKSFYPHLDGSVAVLLSCLHFPHEDEFGQIYHLRS